MLVTDLSYFVDHGRKTFELTLKFLISLVIKNVHLLIVKAFLCNIWRRLNLSVFISL